MPKSLERLEEPPERLKANLNAAVAAIEQREKQIWGRNAN